MRPIGALSLVVACCWLAAARGDDFRIENRVMPDGSKQPTSRSTTIFHEGLVYDLMQEPAEAIVYDKAQRRFLLLDLRRRVRTELPTSQVASFTQGLQQWAERQHDPFVRFLGAPKFEEQFDAATGELKLQSAWLSYRVQTKPAPSQAVAAQYREFSDGLARLNTLLSPGARPPLARLALNEALHRRGLMARQVVLTMSAKSGPTAQRTVISSEHDWTLTLSDADRSRVAEVQQMLAGFKQVGFDEYRQNAKR
jgi:hypothetical protein